MRRTKLKSYRLQVIAVARQADQLDSLRAELPGIETKCCNLADWDATERALKYSKVDLLVNNAGVAILESVGEITDKAFTATMNVNTKGDCVIIGCSFSRCS